jgi:alanine racemase
LAHNLNIVKLFAPNAKIVAMVKANAYGHHIDLVAPLILGADFLAVSEPCEAHLLRRHTDKPILLLSGVYSKQQLEDAIQHNFHLVVHNILQIELLKSTHLPVNIWLKINTGMNRLGLDEGQYQQALIDLKPYKNINIICSMSHFACADEPKNPLNTIQIKRFNTLVRGKKSLANSAAILSLPKVDFDIVRPGIMLYGVSPFAEEHPDLQAVMQLTAPILSIKTLKKGENVGYSGTWCAPKKTRIAVIGIGYGDGYPRHAPNGTPVVINKVRCALIGRVSMDLICVNLGDVSAKVGEYATLWGCENLNASEVAQRAGTIAYELLSRITQRVSFEAKA